MDRNGSQGKHGDSLSALTQSRKSSSEKWDDHVQGKDSLPVDVCNSDSQIERWQASARIEAEEDDNGIVARLLRACIESLTYIVQLVDPSPTWKRTKNILLRCQSLLKLWANGHGAWNGELDSILERSKSLRHTTLYVLNPLCKVLLHGLDQNIPRTDDAVVARLRIEAAQVYGQSKWLIIGPDESASDSDSDSDSNISGDDGARHKLDGLAKDVKMHIDCLVDLSNALEYPAEDPEQHDNAPVSLRVGQRAAHDYHADLILAKFPKASIELAECFGRISWDRYQRMQQEREANAKTIAVSSVAERNILASTMESRVADSEFQDSGLGTSVPSAPLTSYAETMISYMTSMVGGKRVHIPPLSAEAKSGAPFECNACGKQIRIQNNREWRKHLYLDLQPYTCFNNRCSFSSTPFADRQLWSNHLELDHEFGPDWKSIKCPLCLESTDSGKSKILIHFARHMEDIALAALPREVESEGESGNDTDSNSVESNELEDIKLQPTSIGAMRCNVHRWDNDHWHNIGLVTCKPQLEGQYLGMILAVYEDDTLKSPLLFTVSKQTNVKKTQDTGILWTGFEGADIMMSFQKSMDCDFVWNFIRQLQERQRSHNQEDQNPALYAAPDSYWSVTELQSLRGYVSQYGTDWTAISDRMVTKTGDMVEARFLSAIQAGDTDLEQRAQKVAARQASAGKSVVFEDWRSISAKPRDPRPSGPQDTGSAKSMDHQPPLEHEMNLAQATQALAEREQQLKQLTQGDESSLDSEGTNVVLPMPSKKVPRKYHTKSRACCYSCRKRRIVCSEKHPECTQCVKAGIRCEYPLRYQKSIDRQLPASQPCSPGWVPISPMDHTSGFTAGLDRPLQGGDEDFDLDGVYTRSDLKFDPAKALHIEANGSIIDDSSSLPTGNAESASTDDLLAAQSMRSALEKTQNIANDAQSTVTLEDVPLLSTTATSEGGHPNRVEGCALPFSRPASPQERQEEFHDGPAPRPRSSQSQKPGHGDGSFAITSTSNMRGRTMRVTGCLTCRKRRIKCNETRPSCKNCDKWGRQCEWNDHTSVLVNDSTRKVGLRKEAGTQWKQFACEGCHKRKVRCDRTKPTCGSCSRLGITCSYTSSDTVGSNELSNKAEYKYYNDVESRPRASSNASFAQPPPSPTEAINDFHAYDFGRFLSKTEIDGFTEVFNAPLSTTGAVHGFLSTDHLSTSLPMANTDVLTEAALPSAAQDSTKSKSKSHLDSPKNEELKREGVVGKGDSAHSITSRQATAPTRPVKVSKDAVTAEQQQEELREKGTKAIEKESHTMMMDRISRRRIRLQRKLERESPSPSDAIDSGLKRSTRDKLLPHAQDSPTAGRPDRRRLPPLDPAHDVPAKPEHDLDDPASTKTITGNTKLHENCESCYRRKIKCSKERPSCNRCDVRGITCNYRFSIRSKFRSRSILSNSLSTTEAPPNTTMPSFGNDGIEMDPFLKDPFYFGSLQSPTAETIRDVLGGSQISDSTSTKVPRERAVQPRSDLYSGEYVPPPIHTWVCEECDARNVLQEVITECFRCGVLRKARSLPAGDERHWL